LVRGETMLTCPKCQAGVPEEMRFCLQCGASVAPAPPPAPPHAVHSPPVPVTAPLQKSTPTVPLKIAATPVMAPRAGAAAEPGRPSLGDPNAEVDDESLKKSFQRHVTQPGAVICRFCKGPLDLAGDFCEQCGAPVTEAAPPGTLKPKPPPPPPPVPRPAATTPPPAKPAPTPPSVGSPTGQHPRPVPPPAAKPAAPAHPTPTRTPVPAVPTPPPTPPAQEQPSGLMGRLKGIFKKG
jgi:hypothetical protein